jgi:O-antigen/teichoic acid export membrane protein
MSTTFEHTVIPLVILLLLSNTFKIEKKWILILAPFAVFPDLDIFLGFHRALLHNIFILAIPLLFSIPRWRVRSTFVLVFIYLGSHIFLDIFDGGVYLFYPFVKQVVYVTAKLDLLGNRIVPTLSYGFSSKIVSHGPLRSILTNDNAAALILLAIGFVLWIWKSKSFLSFRSNELITRVKGYFDSSLYRNAIYIISTTILTAALGFFFWMVAARYYTSEEVGLASTSISTMMLLASIATLGFNISLVRFLPSSDRKMEMINSCLTISAAFAILVGAVFLLGLDIWASKLQFLRDNILFPLLFILVTVVWVSSTIVDTVFISRRMAQYSLVRNSFFGLAKIPLPIFLASLGAFGVFLAWGTSATLALLLGGIFLLRALPEYRIGVMVKRRLLNDMLHYSFWNYIASFFQMAPALALPLLVTNLLSPVKAAYFYIAWMIANLVMTIPSGVSRSLLAEGSNLEAMLVQNTKESIKFSLLLLIPAIALVFLVGDKLLLLFGSDYSQEGHSLLLVLAISALPFALNTIYVSVKNVRKQVDRVVAIYAIIALGTFTISYYLLPTFGLTGAGIAWIASNIAAALYCLFDYKVKAQT